MGEFTTSLDSDVFQHLDRACAIAGWSLSSLVDALSGFSNVIDQEYGFECEAVVSNDVYKALFPCSSPDVPSNNWLKMHGYPMRRKIK